MGILQRIEYPDKTNPPQFSDTHIPEVSRKNDSPYIVTTLTKLIYSLWDRSIRQREFIWNSHYLIKEICDRKIYVLREAFFGLAFSPSVDVRSDSFTKLLNSFDLKRAKFDSQFFLLSCQFKQKNLLRRDLNAFYNLYKEFTGIYEQLKNYSDITSRRQPPLPIHYDIKALKEKYDDLNNQLATYLDYEAPAILKAFSEIFNLLLPAGSIIPPEIMKELYEDSKKIEEAIIPYTSMIPPEYQDCIWLLFEKLGYQVSSIQKPPHFKNIGNSCYLDSSLQALIALPIVKDRLQKDYLEETIAKLEFEIANGQLNEQDLNNKQFELINKKSSLERRKILKNELSLLLNSYQPVSENQISYVDYFLATRFSEPSSSVFKLRNLLFKSQLHPELEMENLKRQLDASSVFEVLMTEILEYTYSFQKFAETVDLPGRQFISREETLSILQIPFVTNISSLEELIRCSFEKEECVHADVEDRRAFIPSEGIIVNEQALTQVEDEMAPIRPERYQTWMRLKSLPDVLPIQLKRFAGNFEQRVKITDPVDFPENLEIDLSLYLDPSPNDHSSARYEIASYVVHQGGLNCGHYISYVKQGDEYWVCNDTASTIERISREEFCQNRNAYIVVLKRIPNDLQLIET